MTVAETDYAWGVSVGSMSWSTYGLPNNPSRETVVRNRTAKHTAASLLLPRTAGESIRLDHWEPSHPRGSGRSWPPEAIVGNEVGAGRFPLAAAWTGRRDNHSWQWRFDGQLHELSSLDAIASGVSEFTKAHANDHPASIVIPNDFRQQEQQTILDTCTSKGLDVSLLWLPIAASLTWLHAFQQTLPEAKTSRLGPLELPVIHADWGSIRCSIVHLVPWNDKGAIRWLPERRRPAVSDFESHGFGWQSEGSCEKGGCVELWRRLFTSCNTTRVTHRVNEENGVLLHGIAGWNVKQASVRSADEYVTRHLRQLGAAVGVIIVGDFANELSKQTGISQFIRSILNHSARPRVLIADGVEGDEFLARGAAIFTKDRRDGRTSYLDTLPKLELFVDRSHQYEWLSLLGEGDQAVQGGQQWEMPEPISGLAVRRGATTVKLVVAHDEYEGVRELQAVLDHPAEQRLAARLHVSATPAQGNAKLRLITDAQGGIPSRSILANWNRMRPVLDANGAPVDKDAFLKTQPRAFPELLPRRSSSRNWGAAKRPLERLLQETPQQVIHDRWLLDEIKNRLMQKDQRQTPHDATAIGSDFRCPVQNDQQLLDSSAAALLQVWRLHREDANSNVPIAIRALGYMSTDNSEFESWLCQSRHPRYADRQAIQHTSGLVLRSPKLIAAFIKGVFPDGGSRYSPGSNELKAVSQILRYRADATEDVDSSRAEDIISQCLRVFESGMESGGSGYPFRWSSLIIVYMLRRRMFDSAFLNPELETAVRAKSLFVEAIERHRTKRLRPMGGSVNVPAALQQMIDYIDRRGSGDILMAAEN